MSYPTYVKWVEYTQKHGRGGMVDNTDWLLKGCPKCESVEWQITNDGWCYCDGCNLGYPTSYIMVNTPLVHFNKDGFNCFMCRGTGKTRSGEDCDECGLNW